MIPPAPQPIATFPPERLGGIITQLLAKTRAGLFRVPLILDNSKDLCLEQRIQKK
jgi:hypothetical protein